LIIVFHHNRLTNPTNLSFPSHKPPHEKRCWILNDSKMTFFGTLKIRGKIKGCYIKLILSSWLSRR